jgi:hypothetical protein
MLRELLLFDGTIISTTIAKYIIKDYYHVFIIESRIQHEPNISHSLPKPDFDRGRESATILFLRAGPSPPCGTYPGFSSYGIS